MARDYGIKSLGTVDPIIPLFYDEHESVDQPFTLEKGESVLRGDLVVTFNEGWDSNAETEFWIADEGNTGNGNLRINSINAAKLPNAEEEFTITFDGTNWDLSGSIAGALEQDVAIADAGFGFFSNSMIGVQRQDGGVAPIAGDSFTLTVRKTGSGGAYKVSGLSDITNLETMIMVAGRDTDATDSPEPSFGYASGVFNQNAIPTFAELDVAEEYWEIKGALQKRGIHLKEGLK